MGQEDIKGRRGEREGGSKQDRQREREEDYGIFFVYQRETYLRKGAFIRNGNVNNEQQETGEGMLVCNSLSASNNMMTNGLEVQPTNVKGSRGKERW